MSELPEWLDGPLLFEFVMKRAPHIVGNRQGVLGETMSRTMARWRSGERAHYATADRVLTKLGLHLSEIPDEFWRWTKSEKKERGLRHLRNGKTPKQVSAWTGVSQVTVRKWQTEVNKEKAA